MEMDTEQMPADVPTSEAKEPDASDDAPNAGGKSPGHTSEGSQSPDPHCSICLSKLENKSFTDSCFHTFCFVCLLEWSKVKAVCPLCKQPFKSIIHNVRSIEDYDQYHLRQEEDNANSGASRFRYRTTLTSGRMMDNQTQEQARQMRLLERPSRTTASFQWRRYRQTATSAFRRQIYANGTRVVEVRSAAGRPMRSRDVNPAFFLANPACMHRLVPWLNRELNVLLHNQEDHVQFVMELIMDLLKRFNIHSEEFFQHIQPFTATRTQHFIHELSSFACSPYDMFAYDNHAVYNEPQQPTDTIEMSSSSSEGGADDDDVILVSSESLNPLPPPSAVGLRSSFLLPAMPRDHTYTSLMATHNPEPPLTILGGSLMSVPDPGAVSQMLHRVREFLNTQDPRDTAMSGWESPLPGPSNIWSPHILPAPVVSARVAEANANTSQVTEINTSSSSSSSASSGLTVSVKREPEDSPSSDSDSSALVLMGYDKPWEARSPIAVSSDNASDIEIAPNPATLKAGRSKSRKDGKEKKGPSRKRRSRSSSSGESRSKKQSQRERDSGDRHSVDRRSSQSRDRHASRLHSKNTERGTQRDSSNRQKDRYNGSPRTSSSKREPKEKDRTRDRYDSRSKHRKHKHSWSSSKSRSRSGSSSSSSRGRGSSSHCHSRGSKDKKRHCPDERHGSSRAREVSSRSSRDKKELSVDRVSTSEDKPRSSKERNKDVTSRDKSGRAKGSSSRTVEWTKSRDNTASSCSRDHESSRSRDRQASSMSRDNHESSISREEHRSSKSKDRHVNSRSKEDHSESLPLSYRCVTEDPGSKRVAFSSIHSTRVEERNSVSRSSSRSKRTSRDSVEDNRQHTKHKREQNEHRSKSKDDPVVVDNYFKSPQSITSVSSGHGSSSQFVSPEITEVAQGRPSSDHASHRHTAHADVALSREGQSSRSWRSEDSSPTCLGSAPISVGSAKPQLSSGTREDHQSRDRGTDKYKKNPTGHKQSSKPSSQSSESPAAPQKSTEVGSSDSSDRAASTGLSRLVGDWACESGFAETGYLLSSLNEMNQSVEKTDSSPGVGGHTTQMDHLDHSTNGADSEDVMDSHGRHLSAASWNRLEDRDYWNSSPIFHPLDSDVHSFPGFDAEEGRRDAPDLPAVARPRADDNEDADSATTSPADVDRRMCSPVSIQSPDSDHTLSYCFDGASTSSSVD